MLFPMLSGECGHRAGMCNESNGCECMSARMYVCGVFMAAVFQNEWRWFCCPFLLPFPTGRGRDEAARYLNVSVKDSLVLTII